MQRIACMARITGHSTLGSFFVELGYLQDDGEDGVAGIGAERHQDAQAIGAHQLGHGRDEGVQAQRLDRPAKATCISSAPGSALLRRR